MKDGDRNLIIGAGIVIAAIIVAWFIFGQTPATTPAGGPIVQVTGCTVTLSAVDKYTKGSAQANTWFEYRHLGDATWTSKVTGGTIAVDPGDELEILADYNMTTGYAVHIAKYVACQNPDGTYKSTDTVEVETADKYTANGTATFYNSDGAAATAEAMIAGDKGVSVELLFKGTYQKDYGNAKVGYNILNCQANSTEIDTLTVTGTGVGTVDVPTNIITATSGFDDYTYKIPAFESNAKISVDVSIDASDTINPANDIVCTVYDSNFDVDATTNNVISGIQDEDKNNLGLAEPEVQYVGTINLS
jgi:hypothetical protein